MSYDIAVWVGDPPADAGEVYDQMMDELEELWEQEVPPAPSVLAFLLDVVAAWPDDDWDADDFPWSLAPVVPDSGAGGVAYLCLTVHERLDQMVADIARIGREHGLVVYDPQAERVLS